MAGAEFYANENFLVPAFEVRLEGKAGEKIAMRDVQEITFTDDMAAPGTFEFVLNDWDVVTKSVKYSSPWNAQGQPSKIDGQTDAPNFEPGVRLELLFGYIGRNPIQPIMTGEIISLSPSFPASGMPTVRVRAIDADFRDLQRIMIEGEYEGTTKDIISKLCNENNYEPDVSQITEPGEPKQKAAVEGTLYDALTSRAKDYRMFFGFAPPPPTPNGQKVKKATIRFTRLAAQKEEPVAEFRWGRTLQSFTPVMSSSSQISEVIVSGPDTSAKKDKRNIRVSMKMSELPWLAEALGPTGLAAVEASGKGIKELLKPSNLKTEADAKKAAVDRLTEIASTLITATGTSIGVPALRAGTRIKVLDIGLRFEGIYLLTQTTHTIGGSGYTTSFQARKEILNV